MSKQAMKKMADSIEKILPKDFGFTILVFPFNSPGVSNYISNANRSDMIKAMREAAVPFLIELNSSKFGTT